jgi:hypothetical protein
MMRWIDERTTSLDERVALARSASGWTFLSRALAVIRALQSETVIRDAFRELLAEEADAVKRHRAGYKDSLRAATALRARVENDHPGWLRHANAADDDYDVQFTAEAFDRHIMRETADGSLGAAAPGKASHEEDEHVVHVLRPLRSWIAKGDGAGEGSEGENHEEGDDPEGRGEPRFEGEESEAEWMSAYNKIEDTWELQSRMRKLELASSGAAAARLVEFYENAHAERPRELDSILRLLMLKNSIYGPLYARLHDDDSPRWQDKPQAGDGEPPTAEQRLLADLELVAAEVRFRLLGMKSLGEVLRRFKHRCEAFQAKTLRETAEAAPRPEDPLRDACAAYLFDQGVDVITEVPASQLRADILGPSIYVEAKQYTANDQAKIIRGYQQLLGTLLRLHASPMAPAEAFYVVFRRSEKAPLFELPAAPLLQHGIRIHCVLVDLVPPAGAGSRERTRMVRISEEQLWPHAQEEPAVAQTAAGVASTPSAARTERRPAKKAESTAPRRNGAKAAKKAKAPGRKEAKAAKKAKAPGRKEAKAARKAGRTPRSHARRTRGRSLDEPETTPEHHPRPRDAPGPGRRRVRAVHGHRPPSRHSSTSAEVSHGPSKRRNSVALPTPYASSGRRSRATASSSRPVTLSLAINC